MNESANQSVSSICLLQIQIHCREVIITSLGPDPREFAYQDRRQTDLAVISVLCQLWTAVPFILHSALK